MNVTRSSVVLPFISNYLKKEEHMANVTIQGILNWLGTVGMHCLVQGFLSPSKEILQKRTTIDNCVEKWPV
jgi:hypothetical protein